MRAIKKFFDDDGEFLAKFCIVERKANEVWKGPFLYITWIDIEIVVS